MERKKERGVENRERPSLAKASKKEEYGEAMLRRKENPMCGNKRAEKRQQRAEEKRDTVCAQISEGRHMGPTFPGIKP